MEVREYLEKIVAKEGLSVEESRQLFLHLMSGEVPSPLFAGILTALRTKGETIEEITGAVLAMRELMVKISAPEKTMDLCGTGGDRKETLNVSTATSLLLSAMGYDVAKHGNRAISSRCGSADLIQALSLPVELGPEEAENWISKYHFAFLFAPRYHPAMRYAAEPRKALGIRTIFNILGPLLNPAQVRYQIIGVFSPSYLRPMGEVLSHLGSKGVILLHGKEGLDEVSPEGETIYLEVRDGIFREGIISPADFSVDPVPLSLLKGESPEGNRKRLVDAFQGKDLPFATWIAMNSAVALFALEEIPLKEGFQTSFNFLKSGEGYSYLKELTKGKV